MHRDVAESVDLLLAAMNQRAADTTAGAAKTPAAALAMAHLSSPTEATPGAGVRAVRTSKPLPTPHTELRR